MRKPRKPRLTYANVVSTVALFAALGGVSYAAAGALAPGSVGRRQLKNRAVTPPKLSFGYGSGTWMNQSRVVGLHFVGCAKPPVHKCGPPGFTRVAGTFVRVTRPARVMITVSNLVSIGARSNSATVDLDSHIYGRGGGFGSGGGEPCSATMSVRPGDTETVSCTGALPKTLRPGRYRLEIYEFASARGSLHQSATAQEVALTWWTVAPGTPAP